MRALVLGLVGAVVAIGGAQAKVCKLNGAALVAAERGGGDPAFAGARFKVIRAATRSIGRTSGQISVEIEGDKGRFVVVQDYVPQSVPWASADSVPADKAGRKVNWLRHATAFEREVWSRDPSLDIYSGPLSGFSLQQANCR